MTPAVPRTPSRPRQLPPLQGCAGLVCWAGQKDRGRGAGIRGHNDIPPARMAIIVVIIKQNISIDEDVEKLEVFHASTMLVGK